MMHLVQIFLPRLHAITYDEGAIRLLLNDCTEAVKGALGLLSKDVNVVEPRYTRGSGTATIEVSQYCANPEYKPAALRMLSDDLARAFHLTLPGITVQVVIVIVEHQTTTYPCQPAAE